MTDSTNPETAMVKAEDIVAVRMKNSRGRGHRTAYKNTVTNKFISTSEAHSICSAKELSNFLAEAEQGETETRKQRMLKHVYKVFMDSTDGKNLLAQAKVLHLFDDLSGDRLQREALLKKAPEATNKITTVFIDNSIVSTPARQERVESEKKTRPSWAEVTSIETNPAPNTVATKQPKHDRRQDVVPRRYCAGWGKRKEDSTKL